MTIIGVGLDLIDLPRFATLYLDDQDVLDRCFTPTEQLEAGDDTHRAGRLAARFAAKEAVFKSIGGGVEIAHTDIEILRGPSGAPRVVLHSSAQARASVVGVSQILLTLTHSDGAAAAVAIAVSGDPR